MMITLRNIKATTIVAVFLSVTAIFVSNIVSAEETWDFAKPVWCDEDELVGLSKYQSSDNLQGYYVGHYYQQYQTYVSVSQYPPLGEYNWDLTAPFIDVDRNGVWDSWEPAIKYDINGRIRRAEIDFDTGEREPWGRWQYTDACGNWHNWQFWVFEQHSTSRKDNLQSLFWDQWDYWRYSKMKFGFCISQNIKGKIPKIITFNVISRYYGYVYYDDISYYVLESTILNERKRIQPDKGNSLVVNGLGTLVFDLEGTFSKGDKLEIELKFIDPEKWESQERIYKDSNGVSWKRKETDRYKGIHIQPAPMLKVFVRDISAKDSIFYPSLGETTIIDFLGGSEQIDVDIVNLITGQTVTTMPVGDTQPEGGMVSWDGKDKNGNIVGKGLYAIRVRLKDYNGNQRYDSMTPTSPISAYVSSILTDPTANKATFKYSVTGGGDPVPKTAKVYMNLYDDKFRLIKRLLQGGDNIPIAVNQTVSWNYSAYASGNYYYTIWAEDNRGEQAHVRSGKFTVPAHEIVGVPDMAPIVKPGWEYEGPIVRVVGGLDLLVDSNNDGIANENDNPVEKTEPGFVLWMNNDNDHWDVCDPINEDRYWADDRDARGQKDQLDNLNNTINGIHDLEDFFSMRLKITGRPEGGKFYLEGAPIRVFKRYFAESENPAENIKKEKQNTYLLDINVAKEQHKADSLGEVGVNSRLEITPEDFTEGKLWLIFEGLARGAYELKFYQEVYGAKTDEDIVKITIKDVWDMYKFWDLRVNKVLNDKGFEIYDPDAAVTSTGQYYPPNHDKMFVFLHGFNVDFNSARKWTDTMYKRLYRAGYRGGFSGLTWEGDIGTLLLPASYFNRNWLNAFRVAELTKRTIIKIEQEWGKGPVTVGAHSLGNTVVMAAVRNLAYEGENNIVSKIIHMEAASPANAYHENFGLPLDYFDGSFRDNFDAVPTVVNSWSAADEILITFDLIIGPSLYGLSTPDYKNGPVFGKPVFLYKMSLAKAMGHRPAANDFPAYLSNAKNFTDWSGMPNEKNHPHGIRDHGSMLTEYYADVKVFFDEIMDIIKQK